MSKRTAVSLSCPVEGIFVSVCVCVVHNDARSVVVRAAAISYHYYDIGLDVIFFCWCFLGNMSVLLFIMVFEWIGGVLKKCFDM